MSLDVELRIGDEVVFKWNITHNLTSMADRAGFYRAAWRPDESGWANASDIADKLVDGVSYMIKNKKELELLNPDNGWGSYDGLLEFAFAYARACFENPEATIWVSR